MSAPRDVRFSRQPDGSVLIVAVDGTTRPLACFAPQEWAEVVASVTRRGHEALEDALTLHTMEGGERELSAAEMAAAVRRGLGK